MSSGPIRDGNNYRGGGPVHQGDRGGNYDRPYSNDRPYVNDRPNYGPPAHHGGYNDGHPPYRAGPSGYNGGGGDYRMGGGGGGGGGGGYDNRGRVPIRLESVTLYTVLVLYMIGSFNFLQTSIRCYLNGMDGMVS